MKPDIQKDIMNLQDRNNSIANSFSPNAQAFAHANPRARLAEKMTGIKNKVIDKVSDALSYPARRTAQKSILNSKYGLDVIRSKSAAEKKNFKWSVDPNGELNAAPRARQMQAMESNMKSK